MVANPPAAPTYADPNLTASRYLQNPQWVARDLNTLMQQRYVGGELLRGREETTGGAVGYETVEGIFADSTPEIVAPGGEYTISPVGDGPGGLAKVVKSGLDTLVFDEAIKRRNMDPVDKGLLKLVNTEGRAIDQAVVSLIATSVTNTAAAATAWTAASPSVLRDILKAKAAIRGLNLGYEPNALLVDDNAWAYLASDPVIAAAMAREDKSNPIYSGRYEVIAGLEIMVTNAANLPGGVGTNAWVLDTRQLGFIATEDLAGGYQQATDLVQSKVMRVDNNDSWRLRVRANFAPVVTDPGAGFRISGVA
ncbi:hypothetical protein JGU71_28220 [Antrihabitans sp. YC3-6]|uniref:Major capsid protein n=1 Tax=Antrihabitans stalagmiti TaxID=2799499 RepID=A0A934U6T2_9NOCA|nr:hypothetical protein [Antrihabitans stalagmiti]MBJ8342782.1 hypothetical protein [Antrihabitans stalagmiti]